MFSALHMERAVRLEYIYRLPLQSKALLLADPQPAAQGARYIEFTSDGYRLAMNGERVITDESAADSQDDDLSFTGTPGSELIERARNPHSTIINTRNPQRVVVDDAREPMLSSDGQSLAVIHDDHGRGRLLTRRMDATSTASESELTPSSLNIYEASFLSEEEYAFSAAEQGHPPQIYLKDATHANEPLALGESRYPALSPDRRWMAYSRLDRGVWNLWLRDQESGATRRIADVPCNQIQPTWEGDSKTLLYGTDCGRSLWFTALARRRVIP
jgi:WD40 repeat protein